MGLSFSKLKDNEKAFIKNGEFCFQKPKQNLKCAKLDLPLSSLVNAYRVNDGKPNFIITARQQNGNGILSAVIEEDSMKVIKQNDSSNMSNYTEFSRSVLNSKQKFSDENPLGKARVAYQYINYW